MRMLDNKDVIRLLRFEVERVGGQSAWAQRERIDRKLLNRVLCGQKPPTEKIIRALGLCYVHALDGPEDRRNGRVDSDPSNQQHCNGGLES
jgi:hypothetical protein